MIKNTKEAIEEIHHMYIIAQEGTNGCLVSSTRRRKKQTPEMHEDCERALPWHLTQDGEVQMEYLCFLT